MYFVSLQWKRQDHLEVVQKLKVFVSDKAMTHLPSWNWNGVSGRETGKSRRDKLKMLLHLSWIPQDQECQTSTTRQEELITEKSAWEGGEWKHHIWHQFHAFPINECLCFRRERQQYQLPMLFLTHIVHYSFQTYLIDCIRLSTWAVFKI